MNRILTLYRKHLHLTFHRNRLLLSPISTELSTRSESLYASRSIFLARYSTLPRSCEKDILLQKDSILYRQSFHASGLEEDSSSDEYESKESQAKPTKVDTTDGTVAGALAASSQWRKGQLSNLTEKLQSMPHDNERSIPGGENEKIYIDEKESSATATGSNIQSAPLEIQSDEELQQMWRDMESRVVNRRPMTIAQAAARGKSAGRKNIRQTEEDAWFEAGLYGNDSKQERVEEYAKDTKEPGADDDSQSSTKKI